LGGILADDMGLGKTVQALSFCSITKKNITTDGIVVCPPRLYSTGKRDQKIYLRFELSYPSRWRPQQDKVASVNIMWSSLLTEHWGAISNCWSKCLSIMCTDESQAIKNPASKVTKAAVYYMQHRCAWAYPLQNNTLIFRPDEFPQSGNAGSIEFFRQELPSPLINLESRNAKTIWENYCILLFYAEPRNKWQRPAGKNGNHPVLWNGRRTTQNIRCLSKRLPR